jgi:hypothetical protein
MRAARRSIEHCADAAEDLNNKLDEYIKRQNDYLHQEYMYETSNVKISEPSESNIIKNVDVNGDVITFTTEDGSTFNVNIHDTNGDSSDYEKCKPVKPEFASNKNNGIDAEKLMIALRDIYDKYKTGYRDGFEIKQMIDLLKSDNVMTESIYHYQMVIRSVETFLDRSKYKILPNELMVIYYGMYLLRIKGNEVLRKMGIN